MVVGRDWRAEGRGGRVGGLSADVERPRGKGRGRRAEKEESEGRGRRGNCLVSHGNHILGL